MPGCDKRIERGGEIPILNLFLFPLFSAIRICLCVLLRSTNIFTLKFVRAFCLSLDRRDSADCDGTFKLLSDNSTKLKINLIPCFFFLFLFLCGIGWAKYTVTKQMQNHRTNHGNTTIVRMKP